MNKSRVQFLCTGNSCRSQMAEGWARHLHPDAIEAYSAGLRPAALDPLAVRVMAEAGVDISTQRFKHVDELHNIDFDFVLTVCDSAHEACPVLPGKATRLHVGFDDPPRLARLVDTEPRKLQVYCRVRDEIRQFIARLPEVLSKTKSTKPL
jgi:arsenate reductase (thioredoxin)